MHTYLCCQEKGLNIPKFKFLQKFVIRQKKNLSARDTWTKTVLIKIVKSQKQVNIFSNHSQINSCFTLFGQQQCLEKYLCFYRKTFIPNIHKFHFKNTNSSLQSSLFHFRIAMSCTFFSVVIFFYFFFPTLKNTTGDYGGLSEQLSQ